MYNNSTGKKGAGYMSLGKKVTQANIYEKGVKPKHNPFWD
jgi:hypothetical protein